MKHLFFILLLLPVFCYSKERSEIDLKKDIIENSSLLIKVLKPTNQKNKYTVETSASGILASYKNKDYILTNSHVCLGYWKTKIWESKDAWTLDDDLKSSKVSYSFETKFNEYFDEKTLDELKLDIDKDICAIPIFQLPKKFIGKIYNLDNNKGDYNDKKVSYFTFNRGDRKKLVELKGKIQRQGNDQRELKYLSSKKENKLFLRKGDYYIVSQNAIPGDSGSPLFDSKYNLVGLIFGSSTIDKKRNYGMAILYKDIVALLESPSYIVSEKNKPTSLPKGIK